MKCQCKLILLLFHTSAVFHLCPEMHVMAKSHQRAGNSNWMPKVAPWRVMFLAKKANLEKMAILNCDLLLFLPA